MMASKYVMVNLSFEPSSQDVRKIMDLINEIIDAVPEWSQYELQTIEQEIHDLLRKNIKVK